MTLRRPDMEESNGLPLIVCLDVVGRTWHGPPIHHAPATLGNSGKIQQLDIRKWLPPRSVALSCWERHV